MRPYTRFMMRHIDDSPGYTRRSSPRPIKYFMHACCSNREGVRDARHATTTPTTNHYSPKIYISLPDQPPRIWLVLCSAVRRKKHKEKNIDSRTLVNYVQQYELSPDLSLSLGGTRYGIHEVQRFSRSSMLHSFDMTMVM